MSSRVIVSTSISTILVLLSYVWYRRRVRLSEYFSRSNHYLHSAEAGIPPSNDPSVDSSKKQLSDTDSDSDTSSSCSCGDSRKNMGKKKRQNKVLILAADPDVPTRETMERAMLGSRHMGLLASSNSRKGRYAGEQTVVKRSPQTRQTSISGLSDDFCDLRVSDSAIESSSEMVVRPRPGKNYSTSSSSDVEGPPCVKSGCESDEQKEVCPYVDSASHSPGDDMLASPAASNCGSDILSEGSSDSGKGGSSSDTTDGPASPIPQNLMIYEFEILQIYCPRLIGRHGSFIQEIKLSTGATVLVKTHPLYENNKMKLVAVEGTQSEVDAALKLIRRRFPDRKFDVSLKPWLESLSPITVPEIMLLSLPQDVSCDVILSSVVSPSHIFLQQPTHPSFPSLQELQYLMKICYLHTETPPVPQPVEVGSICAAPMYEGWHRAQVISYKPPEGTEPAEVDMKFMDHGGYLTMPITHLRQIRSDFMALHFQATECYLANISPKTELGWTMEAMAVLEELAHGVVLQAQVAYYSEEGIPCVHLYRFDSNEALSINRELVNRGQALWVPHEE